MKSSQFQCPNCGARQRRPNAKFCQSCGYPLSSTSIDSALGENTQTIVALSPLLWIFLSILIVIVLVASAFIGLGRNFSHNQSEINVVVVTPTITPDAERSLHPTTIPMATQLAAPTTFPSATVKVKPLPTKAVTIIAQYTPKPTHQTATAQPSPTSVPVPSSSPQVQFIKQWTELQQGNLVIHKDIHFTDPEGDAYLVTYSVIRSDIKHYRVESDPIIVSAERQRTNGAVTATWVCGPHIYKITLRAHIVDRAGNQSAPFDLVFDCKQ
jgi:hypothetical protein